MPIYDYKCQQCGKVSEVLVRNTEDPAVKCSHCGSQKMDKLISASYMIKMAAPKSDATCCGRAEQCQTAQCSGNSCPME